MKIKSILGILCLCLCLLIAPAAAAGGSGTPADPYRIETVAELQSIQNDLSASYILMNDIDMSGVSNWNPIGSSSSPFFGTLDGDNYKIINLKSALFDYITSGAIISDLVLQDCSVNSNALFSGSFVNSIISSSTSDDTIIISNVDCVNCTAKFSSSNCGLTIGSIRNSVVVNIVNCDVIASFVESTTHSASNFIGTIRDNSNVDVVNCTVINSYLSLQSYQGGNFIANCINNASVFINSSNVDNCIVDGAGISVSSFIGAVRNNSQANINTCHVTNCIVSSTNAIGSFVGLVDSLNGLPSTITVTNCNTYDCSLIARNDYSGGVVGYIELGSVGIFSNCFVTGCTILANTYAAGICPT